MALNDLTPQLRTRLSRLERVVGWFVTIASLLLLVGLGYYVYNIAERKGWFLQKVNYYTFVRTAAGLKVGEPVRLMGRDVGEILEIQPMGPYEPYNIYIQFRVRSPFYGYLWEDSRAKIAAGDFLGNRYIEVTKGTNGVPAYMFSDFKRVTLAEAAGLIGKPEYVLSEEVIHPTTKEILLKPFDPITQRALTILEEAGAKQVYVFDKSKERKNKPPTAIWDPKLGRYKPYERVADAKGYWIEAVEPPPLSDRLEAVVNTVEVALPGFLSLTNKLVRVLTNADNIVVHADELIVSAKPIVGNLSQITSNLSGAKGTLGEWLLPTNVNARLEATLGSANLTVNSTRTNIDLISSNLVASLENVSTLTSNLAAQVQANGLILTEISDLVVHADEMMQGLKRHWLLKSAFGPATNAPVQSVVRPRIGNDK
jgi:hypothetical protein